MKTHKTEESIPVRNSFMCGILDLVEPIKCLVIFAHGSGSSHLSPRNQFVAGELHKAGFSTFLFDLLNPEEEQIDNQTRELRFNIPLLAERLVLVTNWIEEHKKDPICTLAILGRALGQQQHLLLLH